MAIFASRGRVPRMLLVLSGGAAVVLVLGAAAEPSAAGEALAGAPVVAGVGATTSGGAWGPAKQVAAALNVGGVAAINSVSCGAAGNCSAGGYYTDSSRHGQAFVVNEVNGVWGKAREVAANLDAGRFAHIFAVSCASAGNCSAGGDYGNSSGNVPAFVVNEVNGVWGKAREVAANLTAGGFAVIDTVSCASAGNCTAGGQYTDSFGNAQAFAVTEKSGVWGTAKQVAGALNTGGNAEIVAVSCAAAGNCSAGGFYQVSSGSDQAFVVNQANGVWGKAREVAAALNGGSAGVQSVSCGAAGNCSAGGSYTASFGGNPAAFVVNEVNGVWGKAREVAANLNNGGNAEIYSVSCAAAGNCTAGGSYGQAFVINRANGAWGTAREVAANLDAGGAGINSVSCAAAGNCSAGGTYTDSASHDQAFVINQANGAWGKAAEVAGALNTAGNAEILSVSCAAGSCSAGGVYTSSSSGTQAFVVSKP